MPAAFTTIRLTDGTVTCTLTDGTNYALTLGGWSPQVAPRRRSTLGGLTHEDVDEEILVDVLGATGAIVLDNLAKLTRLLHQAEQFAEGASVDPVTIEVEPQGGTVGAAVKALVLGSSGPPVVPPSGFADLLMVNEIAGVSVRFRRRGLWLGPEVTPGPDSATNPAVMEITYPDSLSLPSPAGITLYNFSDPADVGSIESGFLLIAKDATRLKLIDAAPMTATGYTSVADAANKPEGSGVMRYVPSGTAAAASGTASLSSWSASHVGIVAAFKNNSTDRTFTLTVGLFSRGRRYDIRPVVITPDNNGVQIQILGYISGARMYESIQVEISVDATGGGGTLALDIDYLALIDLDDDTSRILSHGPVTFTGNITATETPNMVLRHVPTETLRPQLSWFDGATFTEEAVPSWVRGEPSIMSSGNKLALLYLGRNSTYWRLWNPAGAGSAVILDFFAPRYSAYLVPV